jgi:uncharacterized membrane protein YphA (DoxX/SURF4 family)
LPFGAGSSTSDRQTVRAVRDGYHYSGTAKPQIREIRPTFEADSLSQVLPCRRRRCTEEATLHRWYTRFPGGLPGVGLLILRAWIGARFVIQGSACLLASQGLHAETWAVGVLGLGIGLFFFFGFLTPLAGVVSAVASVSLYVWHPLWDFSLHLLSLNTVVVAIALSMVGPGALSLDAYFFGRRRIIIPRASNK